MGSFHRWFCRASDSASVIIAQSQVRLSAIETALLMTRSDDPTLEALVFFRSPDPQIGRIRVKYRGHEAELVRTLRGLVRH